MVLKAYKYRIYPTLEQSILIDKHIGACRFLYNLALETKQTAYAGNKINLTCFDLNKQIPELKEECEWLKEINSQSLQQSINNLNTAYTKFFKGQTNFPKFKSKKKSIQSFSILQKVYIKNGKLNAPKFREGIKITIHRVFEGKIKQVTISKTSTGEYFASILVETTDNITPKKKITVENTVGIDLGIKDFLISTNEEKVVNPRCLKKSISKLRHIQRKYSKKKGKRTKLKLQKLHEKIANQRKDFLHKVSTKLVKNHDTIAIETLKVKNMLQNHKLAQAISDVSWCSFIAMLEYKAEWYGTNIIKIGTFEPSSKTCSSCGYIKKDLTLSDREWICVNCSTLHDRDENAAKNIKNFALRNYMVQGTSTKNHVELPALVGVLIHEVAIL